MESVIRLTFVVLCLFRKRFGGNQECPRPSDLLEIELSVFADSPDRIARTNPADAQLVGVGLTCVIYIDRRSITHSVSSAFNDSDSLFRLSSPCCTRGRHSTHFEITVLLNSLSFCCNLRSSVMATRMALS